jgi:eukaryotic-like serine/threonine-protein kinase
LVSEAGLQASDVVAGKYTIVEPIGAGGSATVYRARRVGMAHEVALKVMHAEHPDSENERQRFAREAELVMKLQHAHVVPLLDYGHTEDGVPFLVFALLQGESLERRIKGKGSLSWATAARFAVQVLKALEKAHGLGVVHRDIKPANIFLSTGVFGEVAQVLDFGLAKMVRDEAPSDLTQAGALLGTPRYMAPEQVRGEHITHAADIYSFGLVLAEMLLGRPLVMGEKELDIYVAQGSDKPIFLPDEVLTTPFGPIIQRAVSKPVAVRYSMASQMLADVQATLANLETPQQDVEADLEATRMLDPSLIPKVVNPHAEKMRRVLNAAANKAEQRERLKSTPGPQSTPAPTSKPPRPSTPQFPAAQVQGAAPHHPSSPQMSAVHTSAATHQPSSPQPLEGSPRDPSPQRVPPPQSAAVHVAAPHHPSSPHMQAAQPTVPIAPPTPFETASTILGGDSPEVSSARAEALAGLAPAGQAAPQPPWQPAMALQPTQAFPAMSEPPPAPPRYAPTQEIAAVAAPPYGAQPPGPTQALAPDAPARLPSMDEPPRKAQTGLAVALAFVIALILAGVATILWLLGFVQL